MRRRAVDCRAVDCRDVALGLEGWGAVVGSRDKKSLSTGLRLLV